MMARKHLLFVAIFVLVAGACGGGDETADTSTTSPTTVAPTTTSAAPTTTSAAPTTTTTTTAAPEMDVATVADLLSDGTFEAQSARFEGTFDIVTDGSQGLPDNMQLTFTGAFDTATQSSHVAMDFGDLFSALGEEVPAGFEGFFSEPLEIITVGSTSYLKWSLFSFFTGPDVEWVEFDNESADELVSDFSFGFGGGESPLEGLEQLAGAGASVEAVGTEMIRGVSTTHYEVVVDAESLADELSADEAAELRDSFGEAGLDELVFDMFVGSEDGLLYRYSFEFDTTGMPESEGIAGIQVIFDIFDYDEEIVIEAPENSTPGDELAGLFGSILGNG